MKRLFLPLAALLLASAPAFAQSVDCAKMPDMMIAEPAEYAACRPANALTHAPVDPALATELFGAVAPGFGINLRAGSATVRGFLTFTATNPPTTAPVLATADNFYAGDYAGDDFSKVYAVLSATAPAIPELYSINPATGARTLIGTTALPAGFSPLDMAWDYTTSTMYMTAGPGGATSLYTLNLTTGAATLVAAVTGGGFGTGINLLAHPFTGVLYAVDLAVDDLFSIDKTTGAATLIGDIGYNLQFAQGADFDNATGTAYLCAYTGGGVNSLRTVDLATGLSTSVGSFDNAEVDICAIGTALGTSPSGPKLTATPAALNFGTATPVSTTSAAQTVTLTNSGTTTTTITSITGSGAPFTVNTTGTTLALAPGATTSFTVTFSPTNTTAATGTVTIVSNAPSSPTVINLMGTGFVAPSTTTTITQNTSQTILTAPDGVGVTCPTPPSSVYRRFDLSNFPLPNGIAVTSVGFGIESVTAGPSTLNIYRLNGDFLLANLTRIGTAAVPLTTADNGTIRNVPITGTFSSTDVLVVEWVQPRANLFFGGNSDGQTGPTYLSAVGCGATEPTDLALLAPQFATSHWVVNVTGNTGPVASEGSAQNARTFLSATPNPASSAARVRFATATAQEVTVSVYDVTGRQVATLFQGAVAADQQMDLSLNASSLAPGVYVVRATGTEMNLTQRVTVVR